MKLRFNKHKGSTLIEVMVSIVIFSIVSIPLSMMVLSSIANNKKGENEQAAVIATQQIIERVRANNVSALTSLNIKTDAPHTLDFVKMGSTDVDYKTSDVGYKALDEDIGYGLTANVTFKRKLSYDTVSATNYDLGIIMDSNSIKVTGTDNANNDNVDKIYSLTGDLKICNNINNTVELSDSANNVLAIYKPKDVIFNNIKINYSSSYGPHNNIYLKNNLINALSVSIFKNDNINDNKFIPLKGNIILHDSLPSEQIVDDSTNGVYDINVEIYKEENSNKVKVYSTKTSINIGT